MYVQYRDRSVLYNWPSCWYVSGELDVLTHQHIVEKHTVIIINLGKQDPWHHEASEQSAPTIQAQYRCNGLDVNDAAWSYCK